MGGCRSFTDEEVERIIRFFSDSKRLSRLRDLALFKTMVYTGYRVSEILSIKVKQVMPFPGVFSETVTVAASKMKGKRKPRTVPLHPGALEVIALWLAVANLKPNDFLFKSQRGKKAIGRVQAWRIYHTIKMELKLLGKVAPHSTRKTFATNLYKIFEKDILKVQAAMGHARTDTTRQYIDVLLEDIHAGILKL